MLLAPLVLAFVVFGFNVARAQDTAANQAKIIFPIAELGNCANASDCRTYCNDLNNVEACSTFGRNHGLITAIQAETNLKFKEFKTGPGGCTSKEACRTYCEDTANTDECVAFAEDKGLLEKERAEQIRKFNAAIKNGETPGDCNSRETCKTYCENEANRSECADFASSQGLIKAEEARKLKEGIVGPGGCDSKESCETFCEDSANQQTCLDFAKQRKIMNTDEVEIRMKLEREKARPKALEIEEDDLTEVEDTGRPATTIELPALVRACVIKNFGVEMLERIKDNKAGTPAQVREKIAKCLTQAEPRTRVESKPLPPIEVKQEDSGLENEDDVTGIVPEPFESEQ